MTLDKFAHHHCQEHHLANKCSRESDVQWTELSRMLGTIDRFPLLMDRAANEVSWLCGHTKHGWQDWGGRERGRGCEVANRLLCGMGTFSINATTRRQLPISNYFFRSGIYEWIFSIFDRGGLHIKPSWVNDFQCYSGWLSRLCVWPDGGADRQRLAFVSDGWAEFNSSYLCDKDFISLDEYI